MKKSFSAAVFSPSGLLIVQRQENEDFYPNYWELPGGGAEEGETWEVSLRRELKEEICLEGFTIGEKYYSFSYCQTDEDHYIVQVDETPKITLNPEEHSDYKWINGESDLENLLISENLKESILISLKKMGS